MRYLNNQNELIFIEDNTNNLRGNQLPAALMKNFNLYIPP